MKNVYKAVAESLDHELEQGKKDAILKLNYLKNAYFEHVCKLVLYCNSTGNTYHWVNLYHWAGEIAQCLSDINSIKIKTDNKKLNEQVLKDEFFMANADSVSECGFHLECVSKKLFERYPKVKITEKTKKNLFVVLSDISNYFVPVIASKNDYSKEWFRSKLIEYFEK